MPYLTSTPEDVVAGATTIPLSQFFNFANTPASPPACLIVCGLDRAEYTQAATGQTASFSGNGAQSPLTPIGGDGRGADIIFSYSATTHQYTNATYGNLAQFDITASASAYDVTDISLWSAPSLAVAQAELVNVYALMINDASGYLGSATLLTDPQAPSIFAGSAPQAATPSSIAAAAARFVGQAWNMDGCWVLANAISAEAGAALPVQSTSIGQPGVANGEWVVAYNGPLSAASNWQNTVTTGDVIVFANPGGGSGHITTCVSGSGSTAQLIDNITYETPGGTIVNAAHDGSANDILVSAAHPASQEFAGVSASSVVIYRLDTPTIAAQTAPAAITLGNSEPLANLVRASDPVGHAIVRYQIYDSLAGATFLVPGAAPATAQSLSSAISLTSLSGVNLAYSQTGTDMVEVRAFNGTYWGDWQALGVKVAAPPTYPPRLTVTTPNQLWKQGAQVSLTLASNTFVDPQQKALTYSALTSTGAPLPAWLSFNAATRTFSGIVPNTPATLLVVVTATDALGLHSSETFAATTPALPPVLAVQTPQQSWLAGGTVMDALPAGTFTDPQHQALTYRAALSNGAALPSWLSFNAATATFSGTAPSTAAALTLRVTATDTSNLSASELFGVTFNHGAASFSVVESAPSEMSARVDLWASHEVLPIFHR